LHRLGIDFLTDAHTYGAEGAAACASLPLLNDVKDPTLRDEGPAPTSAPHSKPSAGDAKPRHRSRRNHPQPKPLRGGITWFAEATPSGDRAADIGRLPGLVKSFQQEIGAFPGVSALPDSRSAIAGSGWTHPGNTHYSRDLTESVETECPAEGWGRRNNRL